jgi:predicted nucleotidyltransferase
MQRQLAQLVDRLAKSYGDRLVSVILYGSAADGTHHSKYSDLNVFCVLSAITQKELAESEPIFRWWREQGNPAPLLMTEEETRTATDSFPIEFHDMQERRKVLYGSDVIAGLIVERKYYRAQLEYQLRVMLLRLRQRAAAVLSDRDALLNLCIDSVSTFCVLGRHALLISGRNPGWTKRQVTTALADALKVDLSTFHKLLDIREEKSAPQEVDPATLFENYLSRIQELITFVDRLDE